MTADFLQLGGSSLPAMEFMAQAADRLGKRLTVRDLLDTTSLRAFAARVDAAPAREVGRAFRDARTSPDPRGSPRTPTR